MEKGYNLLEAANYLGIKVRTARQWVHDGKMSATKIPGTRRWIVMESEVRRLQGANESRKHSSGNTEG